MKSNFKFGDIVTNGWASQRNPQKVGIFVRKNSTSFLITDGNGDFWNHCTDDHKLEKIGTVLSQPRQAIKL